MAIQARFWNLDNLKLKVRNNGTSFHLNLDNLKSKVKVSQYGYAG